MLARSLAHQTLEQKHLVGELQRIAVLEVDLKLAGAGFVDHRVQRQGHHLRAAVDLIDDRLELAERFHSVGIGRGLGTTRKADRRGRWHGGVGVRRGQIKFELRRHHRTPAARRIEFDHRFQHLPRRGWPGRSVLSESVGEDISATGAISRRRAKAGEVRLEPHIGILVGAFVVGGAAVVAGDRHHEGTVRQHDRRVGGRSQKFRRGYDLAAQHTIHIRNQALDFRDRLLFEPFRSISHVPPPLSAMP